MPTRPNPLGSLPLELLRDPCHLRELNDLGRGKKLSTSLFGWKYNQANNAILSCFVLAKKSKWFIFLSMGFASPVDPPEPFGMSETNEGDEILHLNPSKLA